MLNLTVEEQLITVSNLKKNSGKRSCKRLSKEKYQSIAKILPDDCEKTEKPAAPFWGSILHHGIPKFCL
jgi:hypothetical protein